jgi:hypothetical protein
VERRAPEIGSCVRVGRSPRARWILKDTARFAVLSDVPLVLLRDPSMRGERCAQPTARRARRSARRSGAHGRRKFGRPVTRIIRARAAARDSVHAAPPRCARPAVQAANYTGVGRACIFRTVGVRQAGSQSGPKSGVRARARGSPAHSAACAPPRRRGGQGRWVSGCAKRGRPRAVGVRKGAAGTKGWGRAPRRSNRESVVCSH